MPTSRKFAALITAAALCVPLAACGDSDVEKARKDIREQADQLKGDLDDLSKKDLKNALGDAQDTAKKGGKDTKREARQLERKIKRELDSRD